MTNGSNLQEPPKSVLVFVLGLLSLITTCAPLGIFAWIAGGAERARVRAGQYRESGLLTAGYVMGIIGTIIFCLQILAFLVWIAFFVVVLLIGVGAAAVSDRPSSDSGPVLVPMQSSICIDESQLRPEMAALIRSAKNCSFDSARKDVLLPIARRTDLNAEEQKLLAQTAMFAMDYGSDRVEVLKALIANPAFCPEAGAAVSALATDFDFSSERDEIMRLLAERGFPDAPAAPLPAEASPAEVPAPNTDDLEEKSETR